MTTAVSRAPVGPTSPARSLGRLGGIVARTAGLQTRMYFRSADQVFFTFLFPVLMLTIFSTAFSGLDFGPDVTAARYYTPGMIAAGILLSGVQNLGIEVAEERSDGTVKRLAGTPLPPLAYVLGKLGQMLVTGTLQLILLLAVARLAFRVPLPATGAAWLTLAWVFALGLLTCGIVGIAAGQLPRTGKSASAVIAPFALVLQFISGVYLPYAQLPAWMQNIAAVFPLKWMAQGLRSVFLPGSYVAQEPAGAWELGRTALVLIAWLVLGLATVRVAMRWARQD